MTPREAILEIQEQLDNVEWGTNELDILDEIARILAEKGFRIRDINNMNYEPPE